MFQVNHWNIIVIAIGIDFLRGVFSKYSFIDFSLSKY